MLNKNDFRDEVLRRAERGLAEAKRRRNRLERILASATCFAIIVSVAAVAAPLLRETKDLEENDPTRTESGGYHDRNTADSTKDTVKDTVKDTTKGLVKDTTKDAVDNTKDTSSETVTTTESSTTAPHTQKDTTVKDTAVEDTHKDTTRVEDTTGEPGALLHLARNAGLPTSRNDTVVHFPDYETYAASEYYRAWLDIEPSDFEGKSVYYVSAVVESGTITVSMQNRNEEQTKHLKPTVSLEDVGIRGTYNYFAYVLICDPSVEQVELIAEKSK